jgi:hypothetical protein
VLGFGPGRNGRVGIRRVGIRKENRKGWKVGK